MNQIKKKIIKDFLSDAFEGKKSEEDIRKVWEVLKDYELEEWKNLKIISKDAIKEICDGLIKLPLVAESVQDEELLKGLKKLSHATVDFLFTIFNEKFFYQVVQLNKRDDLTDQQKSMIFFSIMNTEVKKITSQNPKVANYQQTLVSLGDKQKKLSLMFLDLDELQNREEDREKLRVKILELNELLGSISSDEIIVAKKELKKNLLDVASFAIQEGLEFPNQELLLKPVLDLVDAILDSEIIKGFLNLWEKCNEITIDHIVSGVKLDQVNYVSYLDKIKEVGVQEAKEFLAGLTNHLNQLASGAQNEQISTAESEEIINKTADKISNLPQLPAPRSSWNFNFIKDFEDALTSGGNKWRNDPIFQEKAKERLKSIFTISNPKIQKPWYKDPLVIVPLTAFGLIVIGLVSWLLFRKKTNRNNYD